MWWPFTKWTNLPAPWSGLASKWNAPVEQSEGSFAEARAHNWPKYAERWVDAFQTPMPAYMVAPQRPVGAYSKHPREAMQALHGAAQDLRALAEHALIKNAAGVPLSVAEAQALMVVHLPPVSTPRERCGAGMVPDWDVPFCPRDRVPTAIAAREARWLGHVRQNRNDHIGDEIAYVEQVRRAWLAQTRGPGR